MDRNVVIATVLIAIIMFVWLWLMAPPPPEPTTQEGPVQDTEAVQQERLPQDELATGDEEQAPLEQETEDEPADAIESDTTLAAATDGEAREITIETDLYTATFSTKGATLVSFVLKEYKQFDQETPVQMIPADSPGAIALAFTTPRSHIIDTRSIFFESGFEGDTLRIEDAPRTLSFSTEIEEGAIRQSYTFQPGEYEILMNVEQENASSYSTLEGYEVIWDGGIPFTEGDPNNEAESSGAYARSGGEVESVLLQDDEYEEQRLAGDVDWTAVKTKYFTSVIIPSGPTRGAELIGERFGARGQPDLRESYITRLSMDQSEGPDEFRLYVGPMEFYRITDYQLGLYDMVDYGWDFFEWMTRPLAKFIFIPVFTFLAGFIPNYGIVIIIFAILIKLVLYPLTKTSYKSMARMRELQPQMEVIKEKYGDNPQKQQEQMMKMYKETGVNPLGGCLPMLLQYPIIIALWLYLPQSIEIRQQGFLWANDLSAPDVILSLPFSIPLYGDFVAGFTLLMGISMVFQMRLQMNPSTNPQAKIFTYVFPVMIFAIFNRLAAGLSLYYLIYNIVTALQQQWINRHIENEKDEAPSDGKGSAKDAKKAKARKKAKAKTKS